ncbi:ABC transporter substrate binding protein [Lachnospiraceae bacterium LCP25S3_G4]
MKTNTLLTMGIITVFTMLSIVGCNNSKASTSGTQSKSTTDTLKIGVIQLVEHNALDAAYEGFKEGLEEAGYIDGDNITIEFKNAQGEQSNCATIASQLVNDNCDLILAIATPAAQAVANETKDIPILVTAVTDPADAKLVQSNEEPGTNVTGTSDLTPVAEQMNLLKELVPNAKKIAMLYCSSETNSKFQVELAKKAAKELGIESMDATVSESSEIRQVVESLKGKVDAIYAPTDNLIAAGMSTVGMVANELGLPVISGEEGMCRNGGLATYGINYKELGKQTAVQAVQILKGKSTPESMPIEYLKNVDLFINEDVSSTLQIVIPEDLASKATMVKTEASSN